MSTYTSEPGTRLAGRYRLVEQASTGNGWTLWKAQDETLARHVSVLTFAPGFPRVGEVVTAARAASRLTDPRLAQVFDVEDSGEGAYIVMEWVAGDSLADLISEGPMDPARACAVLAEAASALAGAHAAGQAHLLLTPHSLRWTRSSGVKITGIGTDAALAGAGLANASDPALTDTRDLSGLLYAALTGYWPCDTPTSLPAAPRTDGEPCTPRQISADVPANIDAVVSRALLQRPVRQAPPILTPSAFAEALAEVAPPVPLPEPAPAPQTAYGNQRGGNGGGYGGGYQPAGGFQQSAGGYGPSGGGGFSGGGGYPDPNDPSTWNARGGGTAAYQRPYQPERGGGSRAMVSVVVVLVLAAVAAAAWVLSNSAHKGGNTQAGRSPSGPGSNSASATATTLTPTGGEAFNILGDGPTPSDPTAVNDPVTGQGAPWETHHYATAAFGDLAGGTGYLIEMGNSISLSELDATFASGPGMAGVCLGNSTDAKPAGQKDLPSGQTCPTGFTQVVAQQSVNGAVTFKVPDGTKAQGQDILIWFTQLTSAGFESVANITVKGSNAG